MRIKIERSGGFAGIPSSNEIDSKDLPESLFQIVKKIMSVEKRNMVKSKTSGMADRYVYRICLQDGSDRKTIECEEAELKDDIKSLISYIEKHSKKLN